jgi:pyridoxamine 5'-phosphate oxidase
MSDRDGIFAGDNPFEIARRWLSEAEKTEVNDPNAMALATVDADGMPNVRIVLLKGIEDDAFVVYTNFGSVKSRELLQSGKAAFVLHWKSLGRQIRVRGTVTRDKLETADAYYASRPLRSRIGAWASKQSQPLPDRTVLEERVARLSETLGENPARPEFWGGFRIVPQEIEFWCEGPNRLHDRFRWTRQSPEGDWNICRLYP